MTQPSQLLHCTQQRPPSPLGLDMKKIKKNTVTEPDPPIEMALCAQQIRLDSPL